MKSKTTKKQTEKTEQPDSTPAVAVRCAYTRMVAIDKVKPNPRNCNRHPDAQVALLAKNIQKLGWRHPVIVSNLSGFVVAGHARLEAARKLGVGKVPVDYQDFAMAEDETAYLIADNRIAELAEMDEGALGELLKELDAAGADMDLTGFAEYVSNCLQDEGVQRDTCAKEINVDGMQLKNKCPKCGFEFDKGVE